MTVLNWIDNLSALTVFTHIVAMMFGALIGIFAAALCVAARGPQYHDRALREGWYKKGLRNEYPKTPRPEPPKGQETTRYYNPNTGQGFSIRDIPKPNDWGCGR